MNTASEYLGYVASMSLDRRSGWAFDRTFFHAEIDGFSVVIRHRPCRRGVRVPFDTEELPRDDHDIDNATACARRFDAFAALWCPCELRIVEDHDTGDEDRS